MLGGTAVLLFHGATIVHGTYRYRYAAYTSVLPSHHPNHLLCLCDIGERKRLKSGTVPSVFASRQQSPADAVARQEQDEMVFIDVGADVKVLPYTTSDSLSSESETGFTVHDKEIQLPLQTTQTVDALRDQPQAMNFVVLLYYNNCD